MVWPSLAIYVRGARGRTTISGLGRRLGVWPALPTFRRADYGITVTGQISPDPCLWQSVLIEWERSQLDVRGVPRRMKHALRRALEVRGLSCVDVLKLLRIPINEGEPAALHADEDAISFLEGVIDVVHGEIYARRLVWPHGYGVAETVAEFSPHHIAPHELLIAARMNIDQLHNPVRIRPTC